MVVKGKEAVQTRQLDACGLTSECQALKAQDAVLVNEHIHELLAIVGSVQVQLEEAAVVARGEGLANLESMVNGRLVSFVFREVLEHPLRLHLHAAKDLIQYFVRQKLLKVKPVR